MEVDELRVPLTDTLQDPPLAAVSVTFCVLPLVDWLDIVTQFPGVNV